MRDFMHAYVYIYNNHIPYMHVAVYQCWIAGGRAGGHNQAGERLQTSHVDACMASIDSSLGPARPSRESQAATYKQ